LGSSGDAVLNRLKVPLFALLVGSLGAGWYLHQGQAPGVDSARTAFESQWRGRVIDVNGVVERILADDRDGSPHQRFIFRSKDGVSLLIAHNLELAPRLEGLAAGDTLALRGEYEWNPQGGVLHWTHDDPQGRHEPGYIEWRGRRYQ
jgi:hypothetical protein